ncbi:hypothetical protein OAJ16_01395 [Deltaproteobacteria bacterium]|nr:hypothetical protein [Deltaproteobacteria bacterium]
MKNLFLSATVFLLVFNWTGIHQIFANDSKEIQNVLELNRQGWEVIEKQSRVESRPGLKPYRNLKREVQVVKYRLSKNKQFYFCLVEYDSQLDTIEESCADSEKETREHLGR